MHQMFRGVARFAAIAALTVGGGVLVAVPPAIADIGAEMQLACSGKAGTYKVPLRIETTVPSSGTVGQAVQMGTIKIDVGLPSELVKAVGAGAPAGAPTPPVTSVTPSSAPPPTLEGVAEIEVAVREAGGDRRGGWPAFALAAAPSRTDDETVHLTGSGVAPPVVPGSPGGLSWSAGEMDMSLVPADPVTEKDAAELALHCAAEKRTVLGTVRVEPATGATGAPTPGALRAPTRSAIAAQEQLCDFIPGAGSDPRYATNYIDEKLKAVYKFPDTPSSIFPITGEGTMYCPKATGFVNLKKAGNAVPVALENLVRGATENYGGNVFFGPNYQEIRGYFINRSYRTPATVLGFGFMPTRTVAETVSTAPPGAGDAQPITGNLRVIAPLDPTSPVAGIPERWELRASAYVRVKAGQTEVNGVPLALGNECMTSPTLFSARGSLGSMRSGYNPFGDGQTIVVEDLTIPAFSGCGVGEDLSPLLTASVSGSGNYANADTGRWCILLSGDNCVNGGGEYPFTFTIKQGGDFTAVAKPFVLAQNNAQIKCDSATLRWRMDRGHWQPRIGLAKGGMVLEGCEVKGEDGSVHRVIGKVTQEGPMHLNSQFDTDEGDGKFPFKLNGTRLNAVVDVNGNRCTLRIANTKSDFFGQSEEGFGEIVGGYDNTTKIFSIEEGFSSEQPSLLRVSPDSTCNIPGFTDYSAKFTSGTGKFVFPRNLDITSP
ncbi:hypothetical protein ACGFJT_20615 [Actinomadura geliboluensis]|uniref:hypothetical protein n=1 Tax=Actinomadura geliboluensis TaxID=882440 RepID=UPI00371C0F1B